jgi:phospholipid/cholesterol/gamma-HCH transport system substrate-binding protein
MDRERRLQLLVGGFVLGCVALFAVAVLLLSSQRQAWVPVYELVTYFDDVQGLTEGSPVMLSGKDVGVVREVRFTDVGSDLPSVTVRLQVERSVQDRIRVDSVSRIDTFGLLGDKYVEISTGGSDAVPLGDGAVLKSQNPFNVNAMMTRGSTALENFADLATSMNEVVQKFNNSQGGQNLADSIGTFGSIAEEVQEGDGILHELVYGSADDSALQGLKSSTDHIDAILKEVRDGNGVLHSLIYEESGDKTAVTNAAEATAHLNSILAKVDNGEGTIGLLLTDPTLYEDLKRLLGGAERSTALRYMIRKAAEEEEE